jgi:hypothetical protein
MFELSSRAILQRRNQNTYSLSEVCAPNIPREVLAEDSFPAPAARVSNSKPPFKTFELQNPGTAARAKPNSAPFPKT